MAYYLVLRPMILYYAAFFWDLWNYVVPEHHWNTLAQKKAIWISTPGCGDLDRSPRMRLWHHHQMWRRILVTPTKRWRPPRVPVSEADAVVEDSARRVMVALGRDHDLRTVASMVQWLSKYASKVSRYKSETLMHQFTQKARRLDMSASLATWFLRADDAAMAAAPLDRRLVDDDDKDDLRNLTLVVASLGPVSGSPERRRQRRRHPRPEESTCGGPQRGDVVRVLRPLIENLGPGGAQAQLEALENGGSYRFFLREALGYAAAVLDATPRETLGTIAMAETVALSFLECPAAMRAKVIESGLKRTRQQRCLREENTIIVNNVTKALKPNANVDRAGHLFLDHASKVFDRDSARSRVCGRCGDLWRAIHRQCRNHVTSSAEAWSDVEREGMDALIHLRRRIQRAATDRKEVVALEADVMKYADDQESSPRKAPPSEPLTGRKRRPRESTAGSLVHVSVDVPPVTDLASSRVVFVDNLPGDVHDDAVVDAFKRVGGIDKIEIFQRTDEIKKEQEPPEKKKRRKLIRRDHAPDSSPTCALVHFTTDDGARNALDPSLVVFGVVIEKRPCRTRSADSLTSIFLSNLAPNIHEDALVDHLKVAFDVDDSRLHLWRRDPFDPPNRARLRFQSFAHARWAWSRLEHTLLSGGSNDDNDDDDDDSGKRRSRSHHQEIPPFAMSWTSPPKVAKKKSPSKK